ncbi:archease [Legionella israelensis]|nr:archease [Legionella israelensis]QDP71627.1 archease [Legionella israelensis]
MMTSDNNYFDHDADIGIIGYGASVEECFIDAAEAMFALTAALSSVHGHSCVELEFKEKDLELAFVTWLNLLVAKSQAENLVFSRFELQRVNHLWKGRAWGERWRDGIARGIEVKGATLTMLSVKQKNKQWIAQCVVDV